MRKLGRTLAWGGLASILAIGSVLGLACGERLGARTGVSMLDVPPMRELSVMPGPGRARQAIAVSENGKCEGCHLEEARTWKASLHHGANTNAAYRRSFALEPMPFCRSCHAPEADPSQEESQDVSELGVGCVTCHVTREGEVLAAPGEPRGTAPHPVIREARFAEPAACASCHEFAFPGHAARSDADLMQSTVSEHRASFASTVACASCHMPRDPLGGKDHAFVASRDKAFVARAVAVDAARVGKTKIRVTLTPKELGHAFPTGDLFRRLTLSAEAAGPDDMVLGRSERFLTRHFAVPAEGVGRRLLSDDRIRGREPVSIELDVGAGGIDHPIVWRVAYERVAHPNGVDDENATVEEELILGEGRLAP